MYLAKQRMRCVTLTWHKSASVSSVTSSRKCSAIYSTAGRSPREYPAWRPARQDSTARIGCRPKCGAHCTSACLRSRKSAQNIGESHDFRQSRCRCRQSAAGHKRAFAAGKVKPEELGRLGDVYRWGSGQSMSTSCSGGSVALCSPQKVCSEPLRTYAHRYISRKSRSTS